MTFSVRVPRRRCAVRTDRRVGAGGADQVPPPNKELEALQAHFESAIGRRHDRLFNGITTVPQWEQRKQQTRAALTKMLWHDLRMAGCSAASDGDEPSGLSGIHDREPRARDGFPGFSSPRTCTCRAAAAKPFPVVLYQCGHANKSLFRRHGAWFAPTASRRW